MRRMSDHLFPWWWWWLLPVDGTVSRLMVHVIPAFGFRHDLWWNGRHSCCSRVPRGHPLVFQLANDRAGKGSPPPWWHFHLANHQEPVLESTTLDNQPNRTARVGTDTPMLQRHTQGRKAQLRRKPIHRRPKYYWTNPTNLRFELHEFWSNPHGRSTLSHGNDSVGGGTTTTDDDGRVVVLIPNESLLCHFGRHDLRAAIASQGGRSVVVRLLHPARIMEGQWQRAMKQHYPQVERLIQQHDTLSRDHSPFALTTSSSSTTTTTTTTTTNDATHNTTTRATDIPAHAVEGLSEDEQMKVPPDATSMVSRDLPDSSQLWNSSASSSVVTTTPSMAPHHSSLAYPKWSHQTETRNPKGYLTMQRVVCELYKYVDGVQREQGRPCVWMPRLSEITGRG